MLHRAQAAAAEIEEPESGSMLQGIPASGGVAEGPCRVVRDLKELAALEEGTILVIGASAPRLAPIMKRLAGLVTEEGGMLGGAAYYARERGIPCVAGVKGSTGAISDGQRIRVDGYEGTITLLS